MGHAKRGGLTCLNRSPYKAPSNRAVPPYTASGVRELVREVRSTTGTAERRAIDRSAGGEADLSTQQDRAQAPAWIPRQDGDGRWSQRDCGAPGPRPEEALRLTVAPSAPARLKRRADFLAAARGRRVHCGPFTLQANQRSETQADGVAYGPRIGFTVTKKVGNAVERNRIRRRLREAVRLSEELSPAPRTDYVVVARREALAVAFPRLKAELVAAVRRSAERPAGASRKGGKALKP